MPQLMRLNIFFLISILIPCIGAHAQIEQTNNLPNLNKHYFVQNSTTQSPFIKSSFRTNIGIAQSQDFENLILIIDDEQLIGLKGSLLFTDLYFSYQQKIKDWIAFDLEVGGTARIGTELQSMLSQGVNTFSSFRIGWLVKLAEGEKDMLSASLHINNYTANFIDFGGFIQDIIDGDRNASISRTVPILNGIIGLRYAHGFNEIFGIQGFGDLGYGDSYMRGESTFNYQIGGLFDINLATTTKVPLGFGIFYNLTARPDLVQVPDKYATNGGLNISYTAAPHFNLSLELSRLRVPVPNVEDKVNSTSFFISTKYFFN